MHEFSLNDKIKSLEKEDLCELVDNLISKDSQIRMFILEWLNSRNNETKNDEIEPLPDEETGINDELLWEYWENAKDIISEFNQYGGGSEEQEDDVYGWLECITQLIETGNISSHAKNSFLDDAFVEYHKNNSGFEDSLMDLFFEICETEEEWKHLVSKLEKMSSRYEQNLIANIYKDCLQDEQSYLQKRFNMLEYGSDYWDLTQYYYSKGRYNEAVETAMDGISRGEGRLSDLYEFLFDYYAEQGNEAELEKLAGIALTKQSDAKMVLDRLFVYYKDINYTKAKDAMLLSYNCQKTKKHFEEYQRMQSFLSKNDWDLIENQIIEEAKKDNLRDYMRICLHKGLNIEVLKIINEPPKNQWSGYIIRDFDEFALRLKDSFPHEIIEYNIRRAYSFIQNGNRGTYRSSTIYLKNARDIYVDMLNDPKSWEQRISKIRTEFKNRPAFIDEVNKSKLSKAESG